MASSTGSAKLPAGAAEFSLRVRVYFEDTDAGRVVYYASYLRFMERARTEWLRSRGLEQGEMAAQLDVLFVVREVGIEYLLPGRLDDLFDVDVRTLERRRAGVVLEQRVMRGEELVARARIVLIAVHVETLRPVAIPESVSRALWPGDT